MVAPTAMPSIARRRRLATDLVLIAAVGVAAHLYMGRGTISGIAPALGGAGIGGAPISLASLRGKPVLVQFWATWCGVCHQEAPSISDLAQDHQVLTVATLSGAAPQVATFAQRHGLTWPTLADPDGNVAAAWGVTAYPSSFILDGTGKIRFVEVGYTTELGLRARLWLASLLG